MGALLARMGALLARMGALPREQVALERQVDCPLPVTTLAPPRDSYCRLVLALVEF
jgi:hypothetical protein